jgi:iron uptake system component EfeO
LSNISKLSGEEEVYSGLSLLIFHENYRGILSQYLPFQDFVKSKDLSVDMEVTMSIEEALVHLQGYYDASAEYGIWKDYKTIDSYRRKTIYDNAMRVVRALTAAKDALGIVFPVVEDAVSSSSSEDSGEGNTDSAVIPTGFQVEVETSVSHLQGLVTDMVTSVAALASAIQSRDLGFSRIAYEAARHEYEQIEVYALAFSEIDRAIDARPYSFELGEDDPGFRGFHKIERALFRDGNLDVAQEYVTQLIESTSQLEDAVKNTSNFNVVGCFEGMIELSLEIASKKISGEEETFSDLSVLIFEKNWQGISVVYAPFAARSEVNGTSVGAAVQEIFMSQQELVERIKNASFPVAFEGSATPSFRALPSDTFVEEIVASSYQLVDALVQVADTLGIFLDASNPFHKNSFFPYKRYG